MTKISIVQQQVCLCGPTTFSVEDFVIFLLFHHLGEGVVAYCSIAVFVHFVDDVLDLPFVQVSAEDAHEMLQFWSRNYPIFILIECFKGIFNVFFINGSMEAEELVELDLAVAVQVELVDYISEFIVAWLLPHGPHYLSDILCSDGPGPFPVEMREYLFEFCKFIMAIPSSRRRRSLRAFTGAVTIFVRSDGRHASHANHPGVVLVVIVLGGSRFALDE
mmetsp:Transcript_36526/g.67494  ORF Transcript_36526/g.67494 Transcript_36526/m.67494 type:complete len:219 (+) Transcript_36526:174-830(+)